MDIGKQPLPLKFKGCTGDTCLGKNRDGFTGGVRGGAHPP